MLAYVAKYDNEEWSILVHGETRGKAKFQFVRCEPSGNYDSSMWNEIRLRRLPRQDDKPFTYENSKAAGFEYWYDEESDIILPEDDFINFCDCPVCRKRE